MLRDTVIAQRDLPWRKWYKLLGITDGTHTRFGRLEKAAWWTDAQAETRKSKRNSLGNDSQNVSCEQAAPERQRGIRERGSLGELPSYGVQLPCTSAFIHPSSSQGALIWVWFPTAMSKGLSGSRNELGRAEWKNLGGYFLEMKAETCCNIL